MEDVGDEAAGDGLKHGTGDFRVPAGDSLEVGPAAKLDGAAELPDGGGGVLRPVGEDPVDLGVEVGEEGGAAGEAGALAEVREGEDPTIGRVRTARGGEVEDCRGGDGRRREDGGIAAEGDDGEVGRGEAGEGLEGVPGVGALVQPGRAGAGDDRDGPEPEKAGGSAHGSGRGAGADDHEAPGRRHAAEGEAEEGAGVGLDGVAPAKRAGGSDGPVEDGGDRRGRLIGRPADLPEDFALAEGDGVEPGSEGCEVAEGFATGANGRAAGGAGCEGDGFDPLTGDDEGGAVGCGGFAGCREGCEVAGRGLPRTNRQTV